MTAAVLCIGTELTRGELVNTNASWLAESLTRIGLEVAAVDCVDDDRARIESYLQRLSREHDVLGARAHGMPSIGVAWGYAEPGELERAGADVVVSTPAELTVK